MRPPFYVGETRNFLSFTKRKHFKNYEKCFLFHRKSPFCFRDIQFFVFFPFLSTASRRKGSDETEITLTLWTGLHKLADVSFGITIVIRNGKIVWKHGPYCWYFRLTLKYLGWPYRAYIKTAKNGGFYEELLSQKWLWGCFSHFSLLWPWCQCFLGSSDDRYISKRVSKMLFVCYNLLNSQNIPTNQEQLKKLVTMTSST